jgi:hypothetical protein
MTLVARNYAYGGVWRSLVFCGSSESGVRRSVLCRCVWQECGFCHREDVCETLKDKSAKMFHSRHTPRNFNVLRPNLRWELSQRMVSIITA